LYKSLLGFPSQQSLRVTTVADVRYAAPLIPLAVVLTVTVIWRLTRKKAWLALPLSAVFIFKRIEAATDGTSRRWRSGTGSGIINR
jgi:hypothetical protein